MVIGRPMAREVVREIDVKPRGRRRPWAWRAARSRVDAGARIGCCANAVPQLQKRNQKRWPIDHRIPKIDLDPVIQPR
jgi:hypothetical protein